VSKCMIDYAIRTLEIELAKIEGSMRVEDRYSAYPEYRGSGVDYLSRKKERPPTCNRFAYGY